MCSRQGHSNSNVQAFNFGRKALLLEMQVTLHHLISIALAKRSMLHHKIYKIKTYKKYTFDL